MSDVRFLDAGRFDAPAGRFEAQIAGRLMRQDVSTFENARPFDDPIGIEAEPLMEVLVGDDAVRHIAARAEDAHTR